MKEEEEQEEKNMGKWNQLLLPAKIRKNTICNLRNSVARRQQEAPSSSCEVDDDHAIPIVGIVCL